jgi:hypothetical protein
MQIKPSGGPEVAYYCAKMGCQAAVQPLWPIVAHFRSPG